MPGDGSVASFASAVASQPASGQPRRRAATAASGMDVERLISMVLLHGANLWSGQILGIGVGGVCSAHGGQFGLRPRTDEALLSQRLAFRERRNGSAGKNLTQLSYFQDVFGSKDDLALSPAGMRKASAGRAITQPRLCATHKRCCFGRLKEFDVHGISQGKGAGFLRFMHGAVLANMTEAPTRLARIVLGQLQTAPL